MPTITRAPLAAGAAQAPQFESGSTSVGLMAEHGFSALVTVRRCDSTTSVLFDTGLSPDAMVVTNAGRLGLDLSGIERRQPSLLAGGSILITGEFDRTTDFEHGMGRRWRLVSGVAEDATFIQRGRKRLEGGKC